MTIEDEIEAVRYICSWVDENASGGHLWLKLPALRKALARLEASRSLAQQIADILGLPHDSKHARHNLDGAIIDIDHADGLADSVCMATLRRIRQQLAEVETAIGALPSPPTTSSEGGENIYRRVVDSNAARALRESMKED